MEANRENYWMHDWNLWKCIRCLWVIFLIYVEAIQTSCAKLSPENKSPCCMREWETECSYWSYKHTHTKAKKRVKKFYNELKTAKDIKDENTVALCFDYIQNLTLQDTPVKKYFTCIHSNNCFSIHDIKTKKAKIYVYVW